ncbi:LEA type 2 family protein [Halapricum hydrolyticum]|uniref:LEA type 2 family protein n=1 Tax=Halapricum hydrolyticum TaxID=2979991 RepID=A0AAE3IEC5_9EURY|nr:LEA type 2 family protein [Halapricum hydrolyticum]MCU4719294.1 LEA type 2 family protein [Halapricum hydrolyticum]MCU4728169.1 LEA type 2 family protein [Halapricum hydrolyticum]
MDLPPPVRSVLDALPSLRTVVVGAAVSLGVIALLVTVLVATGVLAQPTVESVDSEWGEATNDTTQIETQARVDNPNPIGTPGVVSIEYTASLNDVVLAEGKKSGIGLSPGENTIEFAATMDNDRIADWWVTHVNGDERSTLTIEPTVSGPGVSQSLPEQTSAVETDLLSSFESSEEDTVTVDGEPLLVLGDRDASWGEATDETTPLTLTAELENAHEQPVTLSGVEYVVTMNNVTLGEGQTTEGVDLAPGDSDTLTVDAALETDAFADWWPTHVRNGETSRMRVELYGLVEQNGNQSRVPVRLYQQRLEFETDLLGDGGTDVEALPSLRDPVTVPTVEEADRDWGTITDETAEIVTTATLNDTGDVDRLRNVTTLTVGQVSAINDVTVLEEQTTRQLPNDDSMTVTGEMDNDRFVDWWPRHINGGERSTVEARAGATIDVGITRFQRPLVDQSDEFETDILGPVGDGDAQTITVANETLLTLADRTASWEVADAETTPFSVETTVESAHDRPVSFTGVEYLVTMNNVTVAEGIDDELRIDPGESAQLEVTVPMDTPRLADWWATHLRGGEQSNVSVQLHGLVERDGERERVPVALVSERFGLTTDLLGGSNTTIETFPVEQPDVEQPTVEGIEREWGAVTDETTEVHADVTVENSNTDPEINDFVRLTTTAETSINDVFVGSGSSETTPSAGSNELRVTSELDNSKVPAWWARHLNRGETSTTVTTTTTTVDVGFTTVDVPTPDANSTTETDLLADLNTDEPQPVGTGDRQYFVAEWTEAEWGRATPQEAPLDARSALRNEQPVPITVQEINYDVSIGGVTLANDSQQDGTTIQPGESEVVGLTVDLDNSRMDEWWVSHIRNDEQSTLVVDVTATIEVNGEPRTVPLSIFSTNETVETDLLG